MALEIRHNFEGDKTSVYIYDTTCAYDATNNDTGWGTPNPEVSDATEATAEITIPDVTTPVTIDLFSTLPNNDGTGLQITASQLGLEEIPDGIWKVKYSVTVTGFGTPFESECFFLLDCNVRCCISKRAEKVSVDPCTNEFDCKTFELQALHCAMWKAFRCGNNDRTQEILDYITTECDCKCC